MNEQQKKARRTQIIVIIAIVVIVVGFFGFYGISTYINHMEFEKTYQNAIEAGEKNKKIQKRLEQYDEDKKVITEYEQRIDELTEKLASGESLTSEERSELKKMRQKIAELKYKYQDLETED